MTRRSLQIHNLSRRLAAQFDRPVQHTYDGPLREHGGGWYLEWVDGPTVARMRAAADALAARFPDLIMDEIRFFRAQSDIGGEVSVLLWLDTDPERALVYTPTFHHSLAWEVVDDPDLAAEVWQRRGRALAALKTDIGTTAAAETLTDRIRTHGWSGALDWLDQHAESHRVNHLRIVE